MEMPKKLLGQIVLENALESAKLKIAAAIRLLNAAGIGDLELEHDNYEIKIHVKPI